MMGPTARFALATMVLPLLLGCGGHHPKTPIRTSLGTLVSVERKRSIETLRTSQATMTANPSEVLLVLTFDGPSEITEEKRRARSVVFAIVTSASMMRYAAAAVIVVRDASRPYSWLCFTATERTAKVRPSGGPEQLASPPHRLQPPLPREDLHSVETLGLTAEIPDHRPHTAAGVVREAGQAAQIRGADRA
jgi:hypothetical protein